VLAHDQSRHLFGRTLPPGRNHLRAPAHAQCRGVWRPVARHAGIRSSIFGDGHDGNWAPLLCVSFPNFFHCAVAFEANPIWSAWGALGIILNAAYCSGFINECFSELSIIRNQKLTDLSGREWAYMTPLLILSLWIGVYSQPFLNYIARPVNAVVRHVRPTYPIPGLPPAVQTPQRAGVINQK